jgi:hypothetical protein
MAEEERSRFDRLVTLTPRPFHITSNPPFGVGLVLCGHVNTYDDNGAQFSLQRDGIRNCKPGIWTSIAVPVSGGEGMMECILRWVAPGTIDLGQDIEKWETYEEATREMDVESFKSVGEMVGESGNVLERKKDGSYYDDGGVCCVISTEYLTKAAFEKIIDEEKRENLKDGYGFYVETLTISIFDGQPGNKRFCIGGMCCMCRLLLLLLWTKGADGML